MADWGKDDHDICLLSFIRSEKHGLYAPDNLGFWENRQFYPYLPSYGHEAILICRRNDIHLKTSDFIGK